MADIFVGNLSCGVTESQLREEFQRFGEIRDVSIILDRRTRRPRRFAFVNMPHDSEARAAVASLNRKELSGKPMQVVYAGCCLVPNGTAIRGAAEDHAGGKSEVLESESSRIES